MDRQTLRDWVHRYNADGLDGPADAPRSGRPAAQMQALKELLLADPDRARDGVVRWRCIDLRSVIAARFEVSIHERTVGRLLRQLGLTRPQPRPHHPKPDAEAQAAFRRTARLA